MKATACIPVSAGPNDEYMRICRREGVGVEARGGRGGGGDGGRGAWKRMPTANGQSISPAARRGAVTPLSAAAGGLRLPQCTCRRHQLEDCQPLRRHLDAQLGGEGDEGGED